MLPDRVSNPGPLTYESGALPIALRGPAIPAISTATVRKWDTMVYNAQRAHDVKVMSYSRRCDVMASIGVDATTFLAPNVHCSQDHKTRKSVIFSHSVISLRHLIQNSKHAADIYLT